MGLDKYIELQLHPERIDEARVETLLRPLGVLQAPPEQLMGAYTEMRMRQKQLQQQRAQQQQQGQPGGEAMEGGPAAELRRRQEQRRMMDQQPGNGAQQPMLAVATAVPMLQMAKVVRAVESDRQLYEVLVDFWSNHFNIDVRKGLCRVLKVADERDVIRPHVLGKFRDLLGASAKSPAMLFYLDNAQSSAPQQIPPALQRRMQQRRGGPQAAQLAQRARGGLNENYARELMELHTLGVDGGYTQKDVQEVARCLTGWSLDRQAGTFQFQPRRHDNGEKVVLGRAIAAGGGMQDGETVLDMLASHPSTMKYVSRKLCQRLVADEPPASLIDKCVATWKRSDGDLREIVRTIATSPEFTSRAAYRQKTKSPFEFAVSAVRALDGHIDLRPGGGRRGGGANLRGGFNNSLVGQISVMGQPLFQYQAPTGYPEDSRKWVSSGALISRLNYTLALVGGKINGIAIANPLPENANGLPPGEVIDRLAGHILGGELSPATRATLLKQANATPANTQVASDTTGTMRLTALVLGAPEFQRR